jgi:adenylate kinase family enzyme
MLIVLAGLPASGKSTMAADLGRALNCAVLGVDQGFPEPTWEGALRRRAEFPPWTDERLTIDSVNPRAANLRAALEYLSAG